MTPREPRPDRLRAPAPRGPSTRTHRGSLRGGQTTLSTYRRGKKPPKLRTPLVLAIVVVLVALIIFVLATRGDSGSEPSVSVSAAQGSTAEEAETPTGPPHPFFASYRSLQLNLPVAPEAVTLLAFHQASGQRALHMTSLAPDADMSELAARASERDFTTSAALAVDNGTARESQAVWQGQVLRLWRSGRRGQPDTAADIGAPPGTEVRSPVNGTVIAVRRYELYGQWEDFEIHIQPEGWPEVDVVLIHVTDVAVSEGDLVVGGVTPIAKVRRLSDKVSLQLSGYTGDGGDHVHVQLNQLHDPSMLEFVGDS